MTKEENRSEGIARLTSFITVLSVIGWTIFVIIVVSDSSNIKPQGWAILGGGFFIAYYTPQLIRKTVYWIIDGFKEDKRNTP
jgi:hypothetical protein